jgi:hypothetical protein
VNALRGRSVAPGSRIISTKSGEGEGGDLDRHIIATRGSPLKADFNGQLNHCIIVDHESTRHLSISPRGNRAELGAEIWMRQNHVVVRQLGPKWVDASAR